LPIPSSWLETHSGPDATSTFRQQSLIQPDVSDYTPTAHYQGYYLNDIIQVKLPHFYDTLQNNKQLKGMEYVGRDGRMLGTADDCTLILKLYPLKENAPSGCDQEEKAKEIDQGDATPVDSQKEKVDEVDEVTTQADDGNQDGEVSEQSEPSIIYVDRELAFVVFRASPRDFFQLIGVDDPKRDRGEVIEVYGDGFVQLRLIDGVSVGC
jgi:hypothetical protein